MRSEKEIREEQEKWVDRGREAIEKMDFQWYCVCMMCAGLLKWVLEEE